MGEESRNKALNEFDEKIINQQYLDLVNGVFQDKEEASQNSAIKKLLS
jgi:hypothetical protein